MFIKKFNTFILIILILFIKKLYAEKMLIDNFNNDNQENWEFISDQVMGGVSFGSYEIFNEGNLSFLKLTGFVSLENNGGFIQVRKKIKGLKNMNFKGIKINSRGNDKEYFIHIRTKFTLLPWQYYQGKFSVNSKWQEIKINLSEFKRSGVLLPQYIKPQHILSVALVAFGKKHRVNLEVSEIAFY